METSEFRKTTSNGIAKELKSTTAELLFDSKDRPATKKETSLVSSMEAKQNISEQVKESDTKPPKEEGRGNRALQKTSSTITLQAIKVQTAPKAELKAACTMQEDDGERAKQPLSTSWQAAPSVRTGSLRTKELEDHASFKKNIMDVKRESQGIPPQFDTRPQSQESQEGEEVTFRCKGK